MLILTNRSLLKTVMEGLAMDTCKDRVALIVGGAGLIGSSTAVTLAREGAKIVINYRSNEQRARDLVRHIQDSGGEATAVRAEVTRSDEVRRLVEQAEAAFGRIDILVNCSGGDWNVREYTEIEPDHWRTVLADEIDSTLLLLKYVVPGMRERRWGRIIHLGMDRVTRLSSMRNVGADYCIGKVARSWMTVAMGPDELGHGITVNCVSPGYTPRLDSLAQAVEHADHGQQWQDRPHPSPQDMAEGIAFLCSDAGRFLTGSELMYVNPNE